MSMADRDGKIWKDGALIDWRDANIHVLTHSLHYGMAVFEGVRAYKTDQGTAIFRLQEHTQRLFNSAKIFQMKVPFDAATLSAAQCEVVRENKLESCYIRPLIWIGSEKLGVSAKGNTIHVAIAAWPWGAYLGEEGMQVLFKQVYDSLKPGGVFGVVEHRLPAGKAQDATASSGYMHEAYVIKLAEGAGFKLAAKSEINANPKDHADHQGGVWALPPTYANKDVERDKYTAIGESDRMTLKFVKP